MTTQIFDFTVAPTGFSLQRTNIDCPGNNLRVENINFQKCANKCRNNNPCIGFVFTNNPDAKTTCQLKEDVLCNNPVPQAETVVYRYGNYLHNLITFVYAVAINTIWRVTLFNKIGYLFKDLVTINMIIVTEQSFLNCSNNLPISNVTLIHHLCDTIHFNKFINIYVK